MGSYTLAPTHIYERSMSVCRGGREGVAAFVEWKIFFFDEHIMPSITVPGALVLFTQHSMLLDCMRYRTHNNVV